MFLLNLINLNGYHMLLATTKKIGVLDPGNDTKMVEIAAKHKTIFQGSARSFVQVHVFQICLLNGLTQS